MAGNVYIKIGDCRFSTMDINLMQALRAGDMSSEQILERYGYNPFDCLNRLIRNGCVVKEWIPMTRQTLYRLTEAGRNTCPPRNPASQKPRHHPVMGPNVRGPAGDRRRPSMESLRLFI